jgi:methylated-DNA-[protein]-cysteine S-methyltransferase
MNRYHLFETAIGWAGAAWGDDGLIGAHLPEATPFIARASFKRRFQDAAESEPSPAITAVVADIQALLRGEKRDLLNAQIDMKRVPEFHAKVYTIVRAIPPGETLTYGEVAAHLGDKRLAQQVGAALGKNPWPIIVPCHRVTAAGGKLGGFSARGGAMTKLNLLEIECAKAAGQGDLFG